MYIKMDKNAQYLWDVKMEGITEILGLRDDEQVEAPTSTEVGNNDGIYWNWRHKGSPWCLYFLS